MSRAKTNRNSLIFDASTFAFHEFLLITLPVAIYVGLESYAKGEWRYFLTSPEWAIATIFLSVQGVTTYIKELQRTGRKVNNRILGTLALLTLIIIIVSSINAVESIKDHNGGSTAACVIRLTLFVLSAALHFLLGASGRFTYLIVRKE